MWVSFSESSWRELVQSAMLIKRSFQTAQIYRITYLILNLKKKKIHISELKEDKYVLMSVYI